MFKKVIKSAVGFMAVATLGFALVGCSSDDNGDSGTATTTGSGSGTTAAATGSDTTTGAISVITREDGSGTRVAFVEMVDVTIEGNDNITLEATVAPGTSVMMTNVAGDPMAIGFASTGVALDDPRVQVLNIGGVAPTVENMLNGSYPIQRPFLIAYPTDDGLSALAQDFVDFIFSAQGQGLIADRGYVPAVPEGAPEYTPSGLEGTIVINGSSSLYDIMNRLVSLYQELNGETARIDVHGAGTGHGISAVRDGLADIALSSRDLRESELEFLTPRIIAIDGIAVIVHPSNSITNMSIEGVRDIFLGEVGRWENAQ